MVHEVLGADIYNGVKPKKIRMSRFFPLVVITRFERSVCHERPATGLEPAIALEQPLPPETTTALTIESCGLSCYDATAVALGGPFILMKLVERTL